MKRMWINQPSTLQGLHGLHGVNVLATPESVTSSRVYFLSGSVISAVIPNSALSHGWQEPRRKEAA